MKLVPNEFPRITNAPYRIAFIGEAPGADEETLGRPFVGSAGHILRNVMQNAGISPDASFIGNVCQIRPPNNEIQHFAYSGPEIQSGLVQLRADIARFNPHLCVLLGETPLRAAGMTHLKVLEARGSLFLCREINSPFYERKCLATIHPASCLPTRSPSDIHFLRFDFSRARKEGESPTLELPNPTLDVHLSFGDICHKLLMIKPGDRIALDIEGDVNNVTCLSIATSPDYAFAIPLSTMPAEHEREIVRMLHRIFRDPSIAKILQNSLYDNFALSYRYGLLIRNVAWDTMLSGWEKYPEIPKALGVQTSIWTRHPAYKFMRKVDDWTTHLRYCCLDSVVTYEIALAHERALTGTSLEHFKFNMTLLPILLYTELRGINYDSDLAKSLHERTCVKMDMLQDRIDLAAGRKVNINSPKQLCSVLYDPPSKKGLGFPTQHPKVGNRLDRSKRTSNVQAILNLQKHFDDAILVDILSWRKLEKMRQTLEVGTDPDNRVRSAYNLVGTETGRLSCYGSPTGSGTNAQTITKKLRRLYRADPGHYFFQCDLSGADGWTVAARCASLGDRTMLDDYNSGLKPAKIIALLREHGRVVNSWDCETIRAASKPIGKGDTEWLYFACKRVQHGTNYALGARTMSGQILADGYKYLGLTIVVSESECKELQQLYLSRYPGVKLWHSWVTQQLATTATIPCASGHVRHFLGNVRDHETFRAALSHEPQANTTFATNKAMFNLWHDEENWNPNFPGLFIEPLHQVHDAVCGQFPISRVDWAISRIREYFNNPITIGSITLTIPFEGFYGDSWGDCDENNGTPKGTI